MIQYSGAAQAGSYLFGVDGVLETPVLRLGDTGGNNQTWRIEELADQSMQIQYSGAALAGTYSFGVNGTLTVPTLVQTSDQKFKENIQPLNNALAMANALHGVSFNWKTSGRASLGFVAQDVEAVLPELVHTLSLIHI